MLRSEKAKEIVRYLLFVGMGFVLYTSATEAPDASFAEAVRYSSGPSVYCVAVGDVNGDGILDFVSSHQSQVAKHVSVFLGTGRGNFGEGVKYPIGGPAQTVALGDFNADGTLDIVTANLNPTNSVSLLLNDGHGAFQTARTSLTGFNALDLVVADFNRDNKPDVSVTQSGSANLAILLGDGKGGFFTNYSITFPAQPKSITRADFNGDGIVDLCVAPESSGGSASDVGVWILLGDGSGGFEIKPPVRPNGRIEKVTAGDINGDGVPDLVVATTTDLSMWMGAGDGTFAKSKVFPGWTGTYRSSVIADFNGDGVADIAPGNTLFFRGTGAGRFEVERFPNVGDGRRLATADFNGDGRPDLAIPAYDGSRVAVMINETLPMLGSKLTEGMIELDAPDWDFYLEASSSTDGGWQRRSTPTQVADGRRRWLEKLDSPEVLYRLRRD